MTNCKRKKIFIDSEVQGAVVRRILMYWGCCLLFVLLPLLIGRGLHDTSKSMMTIFVEVMADFGVVFAALVLLIPLITYDMIKLSHKFTGPIKRLRNEMTRLSAGEQVKPIAFRENDYWQSLAAPFNHVVQRMSDLSAKSASEAETKDSEACKSTATLS